jgi:hypothetical protein
VVIRAVACSRDLIERGISDRGRARRRPTVGPGKRAVGHRSPNVVPSRPSQASHELSPQRAEKPRMSRAIASTPGTAPTARLEWRRGDDARGRRQASAWPRLRSRGRRRRRAARVSEVPAARDRSRANRVAKPWISPTGVSTRSRPAGSNPPRLSRQKRSPERPQHRCPPWLPCSARVVEGPSHAPFGFWTLRL